MLRQRTTSAVIWNFFQQLATAGVSIVVTLLLAKFLTPDDFGLMGMMAVFIAISSTLMDSGLKDAVIRKDNISHTDYCTLFYSNIALGLFSYTLLFLGSSYIAEFYDEAQLVLLIRVVGLAVIINSFQAVQTAHLSRNLNFKVQLYTTLPATLLSGIVAVLLAYYDYGVWSLVAQILLTAVLRTILLWKLNLWSPTLNFEIITAKSLFDFGYKLALSQLIRITFKNIYIIIIAKLFSATTAGYYFFAEKIKELIIGQLVTAIETVTYPALATLQNDDEKLKDSYRKVIQTTTYLLFPAMLFTACLAKPIFEALLPDKWHEASNYLELLCLAGLMYPMHSINLNILRVKGRSDLVLALSIFKNLILCVILLFSISYGIYGILVGQIINSIVSFIPNTYFTSRLIHYSALEQINDVLPALLIAASISTITYTLIFYTTMSPTIELIVFGFFTITSYIGLSYLLKLSAFKLSYDLLSERLSSRRK